MPITPIIPLCPPRFGQLLDSDEPTIRLYNPEGKTPYEGFQFKGRLDGLHEYQLQLEPTDSVVLTTLQLEVTPVHYPSARPNDDHPLALSHKVYVNANNQFIDADGRPIPETALPITHPELLQDIRTAVDTYRQEGNILTLFNQSHQRKLNTLTGRLLQEGHTSTDLLQVLYEHLDNNQAARKALKGLLRNKGSWVPAWLKRLCWWQ